MRVSMRCALFLLSSLPFTASAADLWQLPQELNDSNAQITFEVDSTWHTVHGKTAALAGRVWLTDPKVSTSIQAELRLPVAKFDTDSSNRDERMREVMLADQFSDVVVRISDMDKEQLCTPEQVAKNGSCTGIFNGSLSIRGIERQMRLPYSISRDDAGYIITGQLPFEWSAFNVEDPSILIAKLDKTVTVKYSVRVPVAVKK